jgi:hypothetical protein
LLEAIVLKAVAEEMVKIDDDSENADTVRNSDKYIEDMFKFDLLLQVLARSWMMEDAVVCSLSQINHEGDDPATL